VCSHGFKQSRGWIWTDVFGLVGGEHVGCHDSFQPCPLCNDPKSIGKAGLLWIGERFYKTPTEFQSEGTVLGFSRRIKALPRGFKVGETWVLLAHPKTIRETCADCQGGGIIVSTEVRGDGGVNERCQNCDAQGFKMHAGIFTLWRPSRVEKILPESKRDSDEVKELLEKGITPVFVPDSDKDHQGSVYDAQEEEETEPTAVA